jgi:opacity protein-like surface antigen
MRSVSGFFVSSSLVVAALLVPSRAFASEGSQEAPSAPEGRPRPTLQDVRGWAGLFGGISTAGAEGLKSGALFGGGGAFYFSRRLGVEAGVERRTLDVVGTPSNALSGGSLDSTIVTGGVVVRFPVSPRVAPYAVAGVAYFSNTFEVDPAVASELAALNFRVTEELESALGFDVGGGVEVLVGKRFGVFGEVRYLVASTDTRAELADTISGTAAEAAGSQDLNGLEVRVGFRFVFPRAPRKVSEP